MTDGKSIVINANETVTESTGKSMEQWLLRIVVMYLLFGDKAMGMVWVPYALIPNGYTLKKVTKLQKEAVNAKRRHDDVVALLNNPNTPLVVGGLVTAFFGVKLAEDIIEDLENRLGALSDDVKQGIKETVNVKIQSPVITTEGGTTFRPPSVTLQQVIDFALGKEK
jgi:hypothetical protein